jgi:hypothetical protein
MWQTAYLLSYKDLTGQFATSPVCQGPKLGVNCHFVSKNAAK